VSTDAQSIEENKTYLLMMKGVQRLTNVQVIKGKGIEEAVQIVEKN
jgi:hypothetical protein|tara:strand:+ start:450 stop:587 length:138 start_codon:yes stop_codon:yes gene_type:complete